MDRARCVVDAVVLEGRSVREVAAAYGVSKSWVAVLVARFRQGGYPGLEARSRRPRTCPTRTCDALEDVIVELRKSLTDNGLDAGAETIRWHLARTETAVPSVATIWRVLRRRGFVTPAPQKRPRASFLRFEAALPNECWQADITHWTLDNGTDVEILTFIDDHSRLIVATQARPITKAADVVTTFQHAADLYGYPASVLTDNGAVFNARSRLGRTVLEAELARLGIVYKHSRPYHPQTCGKIERWHQTLKRWLDRQPAVATVRELQTQLDRFVHLYNEHRPHRARQRRTPQQAFDARDKAQPGTPLAAPHFRVRTDRVDPSGKISLRHDSKMFHIGIGRRYAGQPMRLYIAGLNIRVVTHDGELIRQLELDPTRPYQPQDRTDH